MFDFHVDLLPFWRDIEMNWMLLKLDDEILISSQQLPLLLQLLG